MENLRQWLREESGAEGGVRPPLPSCRSIQHPSAPEAGPRRGQLISLFAGANSG